MARARSGDTVQKGLKFFIYGDAGTWKSSLCLDFMRMKTAEGKPLRVLYIDCETGSVDSYLEDLVNEGIDVKNIYIVYTSSYEEVEYYANKGISNEDLFELDDEGNETETVVLDAENNPFRADVIVIDGITVIADNVQQAALNISEKRAAIRANVNKLTTEEKVVAVETAGLEFKDHTKIKGKGKELVRNLITNTDKYVAITGRDKAEKIMKKDSKGNMQLVDTGRRVPESWDFIRYEVFTVLHTFVDENDGLVKAVVENKDRTRVHKQNEIIESPSLVEWQKVIDSNKGKSRATIQENFNKSLKKDEKMYEHLPEETEETTENTVLKLETREDYIKAIAKTVTGLSVIKRKAVMPKVKEAGLVLDPKKITDIEQLKKFLEIVSA